VIWQPLPAGTELAHLSDALQLAPDIPEYAELGLSTMCRLSRYRTPYKEIVRRLAGRIVEAHDQPPAAAAEAAAMAPAEAAQRDFVIAVVAFTDSQLPTQRKTATCYGAWPMSWQPFRNSHNIPVAKYTADLATRAFHLPTRVVDFVVAGRSLETSPGVILMDPWILANGDGTSLLSAALEMVVHPWVTLMVVLDNTDPQYAEGITLARQVAALVPNQNYKLTKNPAEFHREIRKVINRTRRRYLNSPPPPPDDSSGDDR
jgi:FxsC-like protein